MISKGQLIKDLKNLGVQSGDMLYLKISMRSIGTVEGGAATLINAILSVVGKNGTIVVSSFVRAKAMRYLKKHRDVIMDINAPSYAGAVANEIMRHPDVKLSKHPVQKFAIIGAKADFLIKDHDKNAYAYDVLRIMAENNGKCLVIGKNVVGVGTTHVAIGLLGLQQKRPAVGVRFINSDNEKELFKLNWAGMCSKGFCNFKKQYNKTPGAIISRGKIGNADSMITDMKITLKLEIELLKKDPSFLFCNDKDCLGCRLSWTFSTGNSFEYLIKNILKFNINNIYLFIRTIVFGEYQPKTTTKAPEFKGESFRL